MPKLFGACNVYRTRLSIGVTTTTTCYPDDTARPRQQVALSFSQNEHREDDVRTKQSSRARFVVDNSACVITERDARHQAIRRSLEIIAMYRRGGRIYNGSQDFRFIFAP